MTKKEMFNAILAIDAVSANEEMVNFINHEIDLLDARKGSGNKKKAAESEARAEAVYEALATCEEAVTVTDIIANATNEVSDYTNQRVSALLRKLIEAGRVEKTIKGKKSYFEVVA